MVQETEEPTSPRLFRISHQVLCINSINFENQSLVGFVEMTVCPLAPDLATLRINSKQCTIYKIQIDRKYDAEFSYFDPMLDVCQGNFIKRNIDHFQRCHLNAVQSVDADYGNGELLINLPAQINEVVNGLQSFQITIEYSLEKPQGGIQFVVPDLPGTMTERSAHMFSYGLENFSRLWFPCVDTFSEPCTWKIEITVDEGMTAVSCGDLVGVESIEDSNEKTFHYFLSSPVAAPNIALAVGPFEILVDPKMHEVTHFCLPKLMPILKYTTSYIHQAFEFYEELMSSRYPYSYYKQVFVDMSYCDVSTYATVSILSTNLLHPPNVIDQTMDSRQLMSAAVAQQFFGSFIGMQSWCDAWLTKGITGYLSYLFSKKTFGNNEYRNWVMSDLREVSKYEQQVGLIILDPSRRESNHPFSIRSPHTCSPQYLDVFAKKARLVIRMLEIRIGTELLLQVLNKILSLAYTSSQQSFSVANWSNMLLSTSSFLKIIYTVTGKDIEPFVDLWVTQGGVARFSGSFVFNKKRNVVELDIRQELNTPGAMKFVGTLNVTIQELDGSFNHQFKIEENQTKFEITCHSKSRRNKKKKIPLRTGEEIDMDLNSMDMDSPVLWLRLDPDLELLRTVHFEQPDYMWQYQLKYERCIIAQLESIEALHRYPTAQSRFALTETIENEQMYYRVRQHACYCLAQVANALVASWTGPPAMITIFRKMFGSHSCQFIIRQNDFSNFHHYYLLKTMPQAMARLRDTHSLCLNEITKFLLDLFKYADNSRNKWSDCYFKAACIEALSSSLTPAVTNVSLMAGQKVTSETLPPDTRAVLEEVVRCLNIEKLMPCYKYAITISCLYCLRKLQMLGHLPVDAGVFRDYAQPGIFRDVRKAAVTCLVDFIKGDMTGEHLYWVLGLIETDADPDVKHHAICCLAKNPPFWRSERSVLNLEPLVEKLWNMMCYKFSHDSRIRCALADLYFSLYGRQRPTCLPIPDKTQAKIKQQSQDVLSTSSAAQWTPELSSLLVSPVVPTTTADDASTEILDPSMMKVISLDTSIDDGIEKPVDDSMIIGEQSVAVEESVITESPAVTVDLDVSKPWSHDMEGRDGKRRDSISHLSEESLSPQPSSPPRDTKPDDFVVSLDNIIQADPNVPPDIFASPPNPQNESPQKEEVEITTQNPTPPNDPDVNVEDVKVEDVKEEIMQVDQEEIEILDKEYIKSDIFIETKIDVEEETIKLENDNIVEENIIDNKQDDVNDTSKQEVSPTISTTTTTEQTFEESFSSNVPEVSQLPDVSHLPELGASYEEEVAMDTDINTEVAEVKTAQSSPETVKEQTVPPITISASGLSFSASEKNPNYERISFKIEGNSSNLARSSSAWEGASAKYESISALSNSLPAASSGTSTPSLKTIISTGGIMSITSSTTERERDRSHKKEKKKKKKNKHKHKHKHKHDRADREEQQPPQPRERLLLNTSGLSKLGAFTAIDFSKEEESSSD